MQTTTKHTAGIYDSRHIQCILGYSDQLKQAEYYYLRLCGFINNEDLPWIRSAVRRIMENENRTIEDAVSVFLNRCDFYVRAVNARPISTVIGLESLEAGIDCEHTKAQAGE